MAVTKLWPVKTRLGHVIDYAENPDKTLRSLNKYSDDEYQSLKDVIGYVKNGEKTEREFFCEGINCNAETAREQFVTVKEQFGKCDGIQAYHGYMSFREQNITPELAQQIGMEFAQRVWGNRFQVVVTTHLNTNHLHCHFVINSVSFVDGKRCQDTSWFKFRYIADEICKSHGLYTIDNPERNADSKLMTKKDEAGMPTKYNVARQAIDEAIKNSTNEKKLMSELNKMGYYVSFNPNRKYWTITLRGDKKPTRLYRLGPEYTRERILERLKENRDNQFFVPYHDSVWKPNNYRLCKRGDLLRSKGDLYGLYLHYCYRLGYFNGYKKVNNARVHNIFKEDLMKIDELTAQTMLLYKNHIGTYEQLSLYKQSVSDEIETLTLDRTHLRNEIRRVNITDEQLCEDKEKISQITLKLKELRKDLKLCNEIDERSNDMEGRLDEFTKEQEKTRKEKSKNERKR